MNKYILTLVKIAQHPDSYYIPIQLILYLKLLIMYISILMAYCNLTLSCLNNEYIYPYTLYTAPANSQLLTSHPISLSIQPISQNSSLISRGIPHGPGNSLGCSFHIAGDSLHHFGGTLCDPQMPGDAPLVMRHALKLSIYNIYVHACDLHNIYC